MSKFSLKSKVAAGLTAATLIGGTGVAFAYFTSTGQGTGSASVGTNTAWAVTVVSDTTNAMTPGGPTETITYKVKNNSTGKQQLHQVAISVAGSTGTSPNATPTVYSYPAVANTKPFCTKDDFALGTEDAGVTLTQVKDEQFDAGHESTYTVAIKMVNRADTAAGDGLGNQDNCKNQAPPLFFAAS